jgi:hypothetical protein
VRNSEEWEQDLLKLKEERLQDMQERRKHFEKVKREMFGPSSSEEDDVGGSKSDSDTDRRKSTMEEENRFKESKLVAEPRVS